jgi:hypothetical protein
MASCDDIRPLLGAYADDQLDPVEADAVILHLEQCARCRQTVRDQQRVQHVMDSWQPPAVNDQEWAEMGRRLRAELEGRGQPLVLKTLPRTESLESTPVSTPALNPAEVREPFRRDAERPLTKPRQWWGKKSTPSFAPQGPAPATSILRVPPSRPQGRFNWVPHVVGAAAAGLILFVGAAAHWLEPKPIPVPEPVAALTAADFGPIALARPQDVAILNVQTMDPDYNVIIDAGNASDAATVQVIPSAGEQG